ncbi:hypothetical protein STEG23_013534, partial [Scotinomys teguina]
MAPVGVEKKLLLGPNGPAVAAAGDLTSEEEEGQSLWSSILSEVSTRARSKLPSGKNILVFGEDGSGKTTLMTKLQGAEHGKKGRGLEYLYLSVHDEDRDDHTRCNVWILDGDLYHKGLLKFAVSAESLPETLVIFVADMSRPWTVMESLQKWASVLREHIDKMKIPPEEMRDLERKFMKDFQDYIEPEEGCQGSPQRRGPLTSGSDEDSVALPLGDNVLTHNLGIPVLVVCTKCDAVSTLEKEHDYRDEHLDFIQSHLRRFCLQYGAALIYTSVKEEKNLDLLYKYIVHKTYGFHFTIPALVVEKDAVFIPAGWDNEKKIAILHENFTTVKPEDAYEDFIVKPPVRKAAARHQCSYLINMHVDEFLKTGGIAEWLNGLEYVPQRLRNLNEINKLLAHRPWLITKEHIQKLVKTGENNWSLPELVHAVVLLAHYHALASFVFGSGINPEREPGISNGFRLISVNSFCVCDLANDNNIDNASLAGNNFG